MTANLSNNSLKVGIFGIGLEAYWSQFRGLEARLRGYVEEVAQRVARLGIEVVNLGLVDTPDRAFAAGHDFRRADVDLILLYVTTYALSSTVLPVVRRAKVPVIVLNLSPAANTDYAQLNHMGDRTKMTSEWLAFCSACPVPEIANVFERSGIPFFQVSGMLRNDSIAWNEIGDWVEAARVAHVMEHNRLGLLGHYYSGMLDIYSDLTGQCACFGGHVEILEVEELASLRREVSEGDVETRVAEFRTAFDIQNDCPAQELARAARTSIAVDILIEQHGLGSLAYYYKGTGSAENEDVISSIILGTSLLTGRGIPVAGEYEVKKVQARKTWIALGQAVTSRKTITAITSVTAFLLGTKVPGIWRLATAR